MYLAIADYDENDDFIKFLFIFLTKSDDIFKNFTAFVAGVSSLGPN